MKTNIELSIIIILTFFTISISCGQQNKKTKNMEYNKLTLEEQRVILQKGTEAPNTGKYNHYSKDGTYLCKRCDAPLYKSADKFEGSCGWPSFDDEIQGAVERKPDADGRRTEILCANCGAHLGHIFKGEGYTDKNIRHCVNSISLNFNSIETKTYNAGTVQKAYFAGGCFWGVEFYMEKQKGVKSAVSGFMGGHVKNPAYKEVVTGRTGHAETVEVTFDPKIIDYETLAKLFFEIHDFTQVNRQGPDVGEQYRTEIFYTNDAQKKVIENLLKLLTDKDYKVATKLTKVAQFYKAEENHQDYYEHKGTRPYCHTYNKVFD